MFLFSSCRMSRELQKELIHSEVTRAPSTVPRAAMHRSSGSTATMSSRDRRSELRIKVVFTRTAGSSAQRSTLEKGGLLSRTPAPPRSANAPSTASGVWSTTESQTQCHSAPWSIQRQLHGPTCRRIARDNACRAAEWWWGFIILDTFMTRVDFKTVRHFALKQDSLTAIVLTKVPRADAYIYSIASVALKIFQFWIFYHSSITK